LVYSDVRESPELLLGESKFTLGDCGCITSRGSQMCCYQFKKSKARVELETEKIKCLGYANNVKGYHLWVPLPTRLLLSKNEMMLQPEGVKEQENLVCMVEQILVRFKEGAQVFVEEI